MPNFIAFLRRSLADLDPYPAFLLATLLILMVSLPLLWKVFGMQVMLQGWALAVFVQVLFVLYILYKSWGWWNTLRAAVGVVLLAWAAQAIDLLQGYPFGNYHFSEMLQPHVMGVPLLIPMLWLMMLPPAWAVAKLITHKVSGCLLRPLFILVSAIAFTAWDFYLDPQMVRWGVWEWAATPGYFGTPWLNFVGWLVVSVVITFAISPKRLPGGSLILIYALTWVVEFFSLLLVWGLSLPALVGFCLMGGMLLWAALNIKITINAA
ncbi:MAG: hypothetical protein A2136_02530 [Chloroflexi bacterium RBG_16_54_11]|nr:MAG: hypothetical protein A2136_02530 [Chloroflexi bacterium RBG_16_54_11]